MTLKLPPGLSRKLTRAFRGHGTEQDARLRPGREGGVMKCAFCDAEGGRDGVSLLVRTGTDRAVCLTCFVVLLDAAHPLLSAELEYQSWQKE